MRKVKKPLLKLAWRSIFCFLLLFLFSYLARAETINFLPKCDNISCFSKPGSAVISNDGKFVLVVDSSSSPYLKKYEYLNSSLSSTNKIPLNISNPSLTLLKIWLSNDGKRAYIYKGPSANTKSIILSVNLDTNSVKQLNFYSASSTDDIGTIGILTGDGNKIIAGNTDSKSSKCLIVDANSDSIEKTLQVNDTVSTIQITPDFKKAIITYKGVLSQSISIYDVQTGTLNTLNTPDNLFFSIDAFLNTKAFDVNNKKQLLASLGGKHVLHLLDLVNEKLIIDILDNNSVGFSLPAIFPDGSTAIVAGVINNQNGYKVYKVNLSNMRTEGSVTFNDSNDVIDLKITPDQRKAYLLVNKGSKSVLKIIDTNTLSLLAEHQLSDKKSIRLDLDPISIDPYGRYAIKSDSLSVINSSSSSSSTSSSSTSSTTSGGVLNVSVCGNGSVEPGEECETANGIVFATSCTNCKLTCNKGTKKCNLNSSCTSAPANSNVPGTGSNCGCYCNFVQVRKDGESIEQE